ncbi:MAG TPA: hypothetical protein DCY86_06795 [Bdellovibrionales bacterium]|nr:hypothetical protein [Bdellovibrionales bacterium]
MINRTRLFSNALCALIVVTIWVMPIHAEDSHFQSGAHEDSKPTPLAPLSEGIFPCSACHEGLVVNPKPRVLVDEHTNIKFEHAAQQRWCLDCHNPKNRDKLRLASGKLIDFSESYRLCGQCHGPTYRDWKAGVHGKRSGSWNGPKSYYLCVHCHDPHSPKVKKVVPFPAPPAPEAKPFFLGGKK